MTLSLTLHPLLCTRGYQKKRAHGRDALSSGICDIIFGDNNENDQSLLELKSRSLRKFMHQYFPLKEREVSPNADFVIKNCCEYCSVIPCAQDEIVDISTLKN